ncbi:MAG TPA: hypothetical protein DEP35_12465 [Deltaproteobacteria bacterium]|nr:hypothetical protein [Deltaproteobacteria bacterium]
MRAFAPSWRDPAFALFEPIQKHVSQAAFELRRGPIGSRALVKGAGLPKIESPPERGKALAKRRSGMRAILAPASDESSAGPGPGVPAKRRD